VLPQTTRAIDQAMPEPGVTPGRMFSGCVLNNIYKIGALIEPGAFAEIYDGVEVSTGEQVAIKILLPRRAEDFKTRALFLEEARTLTRLFQPGLPRYRTCAQDPESGLTYIVTEPMGPTLTAHLSTLKPSYREILAFIKRLALALGAAHQSGLVHCRLTPDNIRVPEGKLAHATIYNFGSTIPVPSASKPASDGAASDQEYYAPEQRPSIGPWTDVYSLALVVLAIAGGKAGRAGEGPDLAPLPQVLHPILAKMLASDPAKRFQSMDEVVAALDDLPRDLIQSVPQPADVPAPKPQAQSAPAPVLRAVDATPAPPVPEAAPVPRVVSSAATPAGASVAPAPPAASPTPAPSAAPAAPAARAVSANPTPAAPAPRSATATPPAPAAAPTARAAQTAATTPAKPVAPAASAPRAVSLTSATPVAPAPTAPRAAATTSAAPASAPRAAAPIPSPAVSAPRPTASAAPAAARPVQPATAAPAARPAGAIPVPRAAPAARPAQSAAARPAPVVGLADVRSERADRVRTVGLLGIGAIAFVLGAGFWFVHTTFAPSEPVVARAARHEGTVYGVENLNSRFILRVHRATTVTVSGRNGQQLLQQVMENGDSYRTPNIADLTVTTPDGGAVEVLFDGHSVGFAGGDGAAVQRLPLRSLVPGASAPAPTKPSSPAIAAKETVEAPKIVRAPTPEPSAAKPVASAAPPATPDRAKALPKNDDQPAGMLNLPVARAMSPVKALTSPPSPTVQAPQAPATARAPATAQAPAPVTAQAPLPQPAPPPQPAALPQPAPLPSLAEQAIAATRNAAPAPRPTPVSSLSEDPKAKEAAELAKAVKELEERKAQEAARARRSFTNSLYGLPSP